MIIPPEQISIAYDVSEAFYNKKIKRQEAISRLVASGMNSGSAAIYIQVYQHLVDGEGFTRTLSAASFDYFLQEIGKRLGNQKLIEALNALKDHIDYYEGLDRGKLNLTRKVYQKYFDKQPGEALVILTGIEEDEQNFPEGREKYRLHRSKERNQALIKAAKASYLEKNSKLKCQVCNFSFEDKYGDIGVNFIEAHHIFPISELKNETVSKIQDIALVCSNCHRMIHRKRPWIYKLEDLRKLLKN